jgi:hypothetical protein
VRFARDAKVARHCAITLELNVKQPVLDKSEVRDLVHRIGLSCWSIHVRSCGANSIYWAKVHAQRHAQLFLLWPLLAWIYESRFANFNQGLSSQQKLQNPTDAGSVCTSPQFWVRMNGEPWPKSGGPFPIWNSDDGW